MTLTTQDVERIAKLARLALSESERDATLTQLNHIFGLIERLQAVDTHGVEPLAHPLAMLEDIGLRLREDRVTETDARALNMANAPMQENGLFLVPKVIE